MAVSWAIARGRARQCSAARGVCCAVPSHSSSRYLSSSAPLLTEKRNHSRQGLVRHACLPRRRHVQGQRHVDRRRQHGLRRLSARSHGRGDAQGSSGHQTAQRYGPETLLQGWKGRQGHAQVRTGEQSGCVRYRGETDADTPTRSSEGSLAQSWSLPQSSRILSGAEVWWKKWCETQRQQRTLSASLQRWVLILAFLLALMFTLLITSVHLTATRA